MSSGAILYVNTTCNGTGSCTYFPLENNTPAAPTTNPVSNTSLATWRAAEYWHLMTSRYPNWGGNAGAWDDNAKATGWTVESWPRVNSLFVAQPATGQPTGHVGYVADVRVYNGLVQLRVYDRNADLHGTDRNGAWINFSSSMRFIVPPNRGAPSSDSAHRRRNPSEARSRAGVTRAPARPRLWGKGRRIWRGPARPRRHGGGIVAAVKQFLGIVTGLSLAFAGLGATVAFGVFAFIGMPMLVLGLGIFSAALDS